MKRIALGLLICVPLFASVPAHPQTTLFGTTLGKPDPQLGCGAYDMSNNPVCGLAENADHGPIIEELNGNVEQITTWWRPVVCQRVQVALKAKFPDTPAVSSWHGKNGLGMSISGTVLTWKRKNGDVVEFMSPSTDAYPDCRLNAFSAKWRSHPQEKDHL